MVFLQILKKLELYNLYFFFKLYNTPIKLRSYMLSKNKIGIIGLGYVGLPLALAFSKKYSVTGFDINKKRIEKLNEGIDETDHLSSIEITKQKNIKFTNTILDLSDCNIFIVTVPTPVNNKKKPDLRPLLDASKSLSRILKKKDIVIYESTVFPGVTEDICGPILEKNSGLKINKNLFLGYSPERINPGDKKRTLTKITKIISGSNPMTRKKISKLYSSIIKAGVYEAESIKIAEAAKVIENTQRDLNIALINELSVIFKKQKLSTEKILKAAETKWNFISFRPGLVGGHCIGVDPYYLTHISRKLGYNPKIILSGRKLNDNMSFNVFENIQEILKNKSKSKKVNKVLIMGLTFKENCSDVRNSKVLDLYDHFNNKKFQVYSFDPFAKNWTSEFRKKYNLIGSLENKKFDVVVLAVKHSKFLKIKSKIKKLLNQSGFIYDLKYLFNEQPNIYRL